MIMQIDSMPKRLIAIDPGEKRIGVAISDSTGTITKPLMVLPHVSRAKDVEKILQICRENNVSKIIVGFTKNEDDSLPPSGRSAIRLAEALQLKNEVTVDLWDEFGTTEEAKGLVSKIKKPRKFRRGHHDDIAAAVLLQSYIDKIANN